MVGNKLSELRLVKWHWKGLLSRWLRFVYSFIMASLFGHLVAGATVASLSQVRPPRRLVVFAALSAVLPDIDSIGFFWGVPYQSVWGHRGMTHSVLFAGVWAFTLSWLGFSGKRAVAFLVLFFATLSHGLLDALTTGGLGVGFFLPFSEERYFFPWRPIAVSPLGIQRFWGPQGIRILASEFFYIGIPCLVAWGVHRFLRKSQ